ncbi:MAG: peptide-methionine (S)-S-oxide reductase MsrA [Rhizobiaceae bacterium]|nr:peptide-methionine (S)-S-oxide reductase MsrA [Rhizobiaceae bacterium]
MRVAAIALALGLSALGAAVPAQAEKLTAIFAGGCFWSVEYDFDRVAGVLSTTSGYIGGRTASPTYYDHTSAGHREAVRVEYDSNRVDYDELVKIFFRSVDPTDGGGQFCDRGHSYTTAVYAVGDEQLAIAGKAKAVAAKELKKEIVTEVVPAPEFWPAEDYHQDYYKKNPARYKSYRSGCGRDASVDRVWGPQARYGINQGS